MLKFYQFKVSQFCFFLPI